MSVINYFEVDFDKYCPTCKYAQTNEVKDPCNDCLSEGMNLYSAKPVCYEPYNNGRKEK